METSNLRKYKLVKQYPGSDPVGTIITGNKETMYSKGLGYRHYDWAHVETHPEYWEEVVEKDYEILISRVVPQEILSVKRLSDGEIFTVGDKITGYHKDARTIQTIRICDYTGVIRLEQSGGFTDLGNATKAKQPIFLTHDGKDIFERDKVWCVNKHSQFIGIDGSFIATSTVHFNSDLLAYFLTIEDAENYIEKNKVLFTTEDGVGIKKGDMVHGVYRTNKAISNTVVGCNRGLHDTFVAVFSTRAAAENYLVQNSYSFSIKDFWEFDSWGGSDIAKYKRLKRLVKERLNLK